MGFTNSNLVSYTKLSPNCNQPRTGVIDRISPHTMAGNLSIETCGELFAKASREASSNYGIGSDGRVGLYVEEKNRTWCTSNKANDHRAVTIEIASINTTDYQPSDKAWATTIELCADICIRNGKSKLVWIPDKDKALAYQQAADEMLITVHRWFSAKACPGNWIFNHLGELAEKVTARIAALNNMDKDVEVSTEGSVDTGKVQDTVDIDTLPDDEFIYRFFIDKINNAIGVYGLMANLFSESGLVSINLQNSFEKKLGHTDQSYTAAVDNGSYTNFIKDGAGYGLAQWTFWSRKAALLDYAKSQKKSIGDRRMQCEYLWSELQKSYPTVLTALKNATSLRAASDAVLLNFERPADQSEAVQIRRASFAQMYYDKFATTVADDNETPVSVVFPYLVRIIANDLNIRKGPGTNYEKTGMISDHGVYTITEESTGQGAKLWGKLKSGAGWIALAVESKSYVEKVN